MPSSTRDDNVSRWDQYLTDKDRAVLERGRFGRRMGFGVRPALIVIDCQNYMVGERGVDDGRYPSSCGEAGWQAVDHIAALVTQAREKHVPVVYTRMVLHPSGRDAGVYQLKRDLLDTPYWCLEDTPGSEIIGAVAPRPEELVLIKHKPSAFFGTPLASHLVQRQVDTVIITGGATSNCVRATVFDAASYNLRAIVPTEAVFDRIQVSHEISLFDMDRQFADVVPIADVTAYLDGLNAD